MKDRFSAHSNLYAAFRPHYPKVLYDYILEHCSVFDLAWDVGTGNGQVATALAPRFSTVYASDISSKQLEQAVRLPNIEYAVASETTSLSDHSVDLVTVAQAIHWFDRDAFYKEVRRVGRFGAIVAVWGYGVLKISKPVDDIISAFYVSAIGPYWDPERKHIDQRYQKIGFPFSEIASPHFEMTFEWTLAELEGYLSTWSAVQNYHRERGESPLPELIEKILPHWKGKMPVKFPLFLRLGKNLEQ